MKKKLPNTEELNKLIEIATSEEKETEDHTIVLEHKNDVLPFITHFNIQQGTNPVDKRLLYDLYREWSKNPVIRTIFTLEIGKYLYSFYRANKQYFLINLQTIKVSTLIFDYIKNRKIDKRKSPAWKKHFEDFLNYYNLKPGKFWIENYILYHLYDKWIYNNRRRRLLGEVQFLNLAKLVFESRRKSPDTSVAFVAIDYDSIPRHFLNETVIQNIREGRKLRYGRKKEKKSKKSD